LFKTGFRQNFALVYPCQTAAKALFNVFPQPRMGVEKYVPDKINSASGYRENLPITFYFKFQISG
jgi:hypothetical protein